MQYALDVYGDKIEAERGLQAVCPTCFGNVVPKCGRILRRHWAHAVGGDCDPWWEPETAWHRGWKGLFPKEQVEVTVGPHRADVKIGRLVVELQNSAIAPSMIEARERFYGDMVWVVNAARFADRFFITKQMGGGLFAFKWKHMAKSWRFAKKPVYLDFGTRTVASLLGATITTWSGFYNEFGDSESYDHTTIGRYDGPPTDERLGEGYTADGSFASLPAHVLACTVLRKNTLHESGHGSAEPVSRFDLVKALGGDTAALLDMTAFAP